MLIIDGYYISDRKSNEMPKTHINEGTLYVPFDVTENEDGEYVFKEHRINLPVPPNVPQEVLAVVINAMAQLRGVE